MQHNSSIRSHFTSWLRSWLSLYVDGFRRMTWGRPLWILILVKLVVMFVVLRLLFFRPYLSGSDEETADCVGSELVSRSESTATHP